VKLWKVCRVRAPIDMQGTVRILSFDLRVNIVSGFIGLIKPTELFFAGSFALGGRSSPRSQMAVLTLQTMPGCGKLAQVSVTATIASTVYFIRYNTVHYLLGLPVGLIHSCLIPLNLRVQGALQTLTTQEWIGMTSPEHSRY
jgi:hypothetical protein